ncbi:MAG: hypothetical protein HY079_14930 [Elusimicrobia bacterium]|nr:hypothetical protein [Elusimicrobiota bacterium]
MSVTPLPVRRVHVYELLNITRRESLLVISSDDEEPLRSRLRRAPPIEIAAWDLLHDDMSATLMGANLAPHSAREFVALYRENMRPRTWRYRVWEPAD